MKSPPEQFTDEEARRADRCASSPARPGGAARPVLTRWPAYTEDEIRARVADLGPWFHNLDLDGVATAPEHFLHDYPAVKWRALRRRGARRSDRLDRARHRLQRRLLRHRDEAARRRPGGRRSTSTTRYLAQARFAAEVSGAGHRVPPALGLRRRRARRALRPRALPRACSTTCATRCWRSTSSTSTSPSDLLVFQSMQRGSDEIEPVAADYDFFEQRPLRPARLPEAALHRAPLRARPDQLVGRRTPPPPQAMLRSAGFDDRRPPGGGGLPLPARRARRRGRARSIRRAGGGAEAAAMIEAVKIWNEPNNKSHWDPLLDPEWDRFAAMARLAGAGDPGREPGAAARARGHVADRPVVHPPARRQGGARRDRRRRRARLSARLEPLADRRMAGEDRRDRGGHRQAGLGDRGRGLVLRLGGGAGLGREEDRRAPDRPGAAAALVQPLRPAEGLGGDDAAQARPRARPTTATSTWACCARTARPKPALEAYADLCGARWGSASGSTTRTPGSTRRWPGCAGSGCGTSAPGSPGRILPRGGARLVRPADGGARRVRGDGRPSASRPSTAASSRTTPARRRSPRSIAEFCAAMVRRYAPGRELPQVVGSPSSGPIGSDREHLARPEV